jgi:excisionase family DNA binding protein
MRVIEAVTIQDTLDPWLSLRGLAGYSSLSRRTLQDLVNDPADSLPSYRVGSKILVRRSEFDAWMARRRNTRAEAVARLAAADAQALLSARPRK